MRRRLSKRRWLCPLVYTKELHVRVLCVSSSNTTDSQNMKFIHWKNIDSRNIKLHEQVVHTHTPTLASKNEWNYCTVPHHIDWFVDFVYLSICSLQIFYAIAQAVESHTAHGTVYVYALRYICILYSETGFGNVPIILNAKYNYIEKTCIAQLL